MRRTGTARAMRGSLAALLAIAVTAGSHVAAATPSNEPAASARILGTIALANPGFESTRPGKLGAPEGWWAVQHAGPESYRFTIDDSAKKAGARSLRIENVGPEPFGTLFQAIEAAPYRGKTLRFSAWIRTEKTLGNRFGSGAGLHLQTLRRGFPRDVAAMRKNAVKGTTEWTRYELVLAVAGDADQIEVGLNLFGAGIAWIDDATLEIVEPPPANGAPAAASSSKG